MRESTIALPRVLAASTTGLQPTPSHTPAPDWRHGLPALHGQKVTLREQHERDGDALLPLITAPDVTRFMSPPPQTPDWFPAFIATTTRERRAGRYAGFAIVPHGETSPVGLIQIRQLEPDFSIAEWGIALGSAWWGRGLFEDTGRLILRFAFDTLRAHRLEARVATRNARGNAAVGKLGAVAEGLLRQALVTGDGVTHDQILWAWLEDEWRRDEARRQAEELVWVH